MANTLGQDLEALKIDRDRKGNSRRRRSKILLATIVLIIFILAGALALLYKPGYFFGAGSAGDVAVPAAEPVRTVFSAGEVVLTAGGYIVPHVRVEVSSKISGRVEELLVDKGDIVKVNQVLARLDNKEMLAQLAQARANREAAVSRMNELERGSRPEEIQRARALVEHAEADLRTAKLTLNRAEALNRTGVFAQQVLDDARNAYEVADAQLKVANENYQLTRQGPRREQIELARAQVAEADAAIRLWETQLENTVIRAPISGTVLERLVEKGEMVTTGYVSGRGAKSAFVSIADLKDLEVEVDVNEGDIGRVRPRQQCTISPDSYPDRKYRGYVREIAPEANRQKATIQVRVSITEPDRYLVPETNAKVNFLHGTLVLNLTLGTH
jgi:HlyD family secretion protein